MCIISSDGSCQRSPVLAKVIASRRESALYELRLSREKWVWEVPWLPLQRFTNWKVVIGRDEAIGRRWDGIANYNASLPLASLCRDSYFVFVSFTYQVFLEVSQLSKKKEKRPKTKCAAIPHRFVAVEHSTEHQKSEDHFGGEMVNCKKNPLLASPGPGFLAQ